MSMVTEAPLKNAVPTDQELIDFVVREARLIDQQRFDEWLDMYADDAFYWMPLEWNQTDPRLTCSLMYEDKLLLSIRVERLKGARTFSQKPKSRCHHVLQTPQVDSRDAAAAWVTHHLSVEDGKLRIKLKRVDLINCDAAFGNIQLFM
jgi:3-phenylpropionate/cinnamic acid dioxygenase small subunit